MTRWPEIAAAFALVATLAGAVIAQTLTKPAASAAKPARDEPQVTVADGNSFAIRNVRVFDGARVIDRANVVVRDGRIAAVGQDADIPADLVAIDGKGKTLLPGLIDAHVHSWGTAQADALRFGVTTALDMLGDWNRLPALRGQRESLANTAQADLWSAGAAVTAPGGHGTQYGMQVPTLAAGDDPAAFVAARVAEGSDYLKLIVEDMSEHGGTARMATIDAAQMRAAIAAAHGARRLAVVHVSKQADALQAVEAGADGLAHVFIDAAAGADFVRAAKARDAFVVPTLSVIATMAQSGEGAALAADARLAPWLAPEQIDALKSTYTMAARPQALERALRSVRDLHAAGVTVLAGTDAGNPGTAHGASIHGELALLVRAGLSPAQALAAATSLPAKRFDLGDRGRIARGMRADLLLVDGDPTTDITATRAIAGIWKNGYAIERVRPQAERAIAPIADGALIADFDAGEVAARFGSLLQTTDAMAGGKSTVAQRWVEGGAEGSRGALDIAGEIRPGFAHPWAGTMFFPAATMQPVDASARRELVFWTRGDGRRYSVMVFSGASAQSYPAMRPFDAGAEWQQVRIPLSDFAGADMSQLRGIAFTAGQPAGAFAFRIDQVELR